MADLERGINPSNIIWQAPSTNTDGTPIEGALTYNLYRSDPGAESYELFFVVVGTLQQDGTYVAPVENFPDGDHEIVLTAVDEQGDESAFSNSVGFTITGVSVPRAPVLL